MNYFTYNTVSLLFQRSHLHSHYTIQANMNFLLPSTFSLAIFEVGWIESVCAAVTTCGPYILRLISAYFADTCSISVEAVCRNNLHTCKHNTHNRMLLCWASICWDMRTCSVVEAYQPSSILLAAWLTLWPWRWG